MKRPACKSAFSLVEILVTVTIIVVLAALLFPAAQGVFERGRSATCTGRLRAIGVGLAQYIADNDGKLIPYASMGGATSFWFDALNPYMGTPDNEDATMPHKWQTCPSKPVKPENRQVVGYGWNHKNFGYTKPPQDEKDEYGGNARITNLKDLAKTIIIADSMDFPEDGSIPPVSQHRYLYQSDTSNVRLAARHFGRGNYLMLDGHVESLLRDDIAGPEATPEGKRLWLQKK